MNVCTTTCVQATAPCRPLKNAAPPPPGAPPQVPLDLLVGGDHSFLFALHLPDPRLAATSLVRRLRQILDEVSLAAFGTTSDLVLAAEGGDGQVRGGRGGWREGQGRGSRGLVRATC